jgi:tetratricopeptide (TPR) repeat protein/predicted aspartyl protease
MIPASLAGQCTLGKVAEFPITMVDLRPLMTAKINGTDVRFMVDSGAFWSVISPASAAELNLSTRPAPMGFFMRGANGSASTAITEVKDFGLPGNVTLHNVEFLVAGSQIDRTSVGVLGQNVLHYADVEYDLAQGVIRLMKLAGSCGKMAPVYWVAKSGAGYSEIDIESRERTSSASGHASINGTDIRVLFDSGAGVSTLTLKAAARVGIRPDSPGVVEGGLTGGFGRNMVPSYIAPFENFKIGDEEIRHTRLRIADLDFFGADMLIGPDFFLSHRIYVANSKQKLYFTYNGGPVFNLTYIHQGAASSVPDSPATPSPAADPAPVSGAPRGLPPEESKAAAASGDAADFSRRGTAMASRGDYDHALAALSRACELAPDNAEYHFQRGQVYMRMGNRVLAGGDLDQTLKLNPQHVAALISRAELLLANRDLTGALADLDAANRTATKQADLRYEMATAYERADRLSSAVEQYDLWIAAHAEDERIPHAQNGRCWVRALMGSDLSLALKDCNAALKRANKGSPFYAQVSDSRGLVLLRLGDYPKSIADYDGAIAIAPKIAWSWYGRGIDKLRQHQNAAGDADIAQANSLLPTIGAAATHYGIAP